MAPISELLELICHPLSVRPSTCPAIIVAIVADDAKFWYFLFSFRWIQGLGPRRGSLSVSGGAYCYWMQPTGGLLTVHRESSSVFRLWRSETQTRIYICEIVFQNSINLFTREILRSHGYARFRIPTSRTALYPTSQQFDWFLVYLRTDPAAQYQYRNTTHIKFSQKLKQNAKQQNQNI